MQLRHFAKRRLLWLGFFAVFIPLAAMLALQYRWLTSLEKASALASQAWLRNYVEAVVGQVELGYVSEAERALTIPESLFEYPDRKFAYHWSKREVRGAKYLFAVRYDGEPEWEDHLIVYDPDQDKLGEPEDSATLNAIRVALSPWRMLANKGATVPSHGMSVDEKDPLNRIIVNAISDDACRVVGVVGMVLDNDYFEEQILGRAIEKKLPKYFDVKAETQMDIRVENHRGQVVYGAPGPVPATDSEAPFDTVTRPFSFVFTDWELSLTSHHSPEQWAKSNFMLNITLSALLGVVLLGGVALALRTASREIHLSQMKSDFVSNVSHELRTPLASIRVFGEFFRLGRVKDSQKAREYGEFIETESRRLTQLINNILDFSKIESGAKTYDFERVDVREVIGDVLRTLEVALRHRGFRVNLSVPSAELPSLSLDPDAIGQAVANLVENAVKFSAGEKEIDVVVAFDREQVLLSVRDRGIGISRHEQKRIFERFHRVSTGLVHDVKGSGLGLAIVQHVVEAHRGRITVDSEPGKGSTFTIHLPVEQDGAPIAPLASATRSIGEA